MKIYKTSIAAILMSGSKLFGLMKRSGCRAVQIHNNAGFLMLMDQKTMTIPLDHETTSESHNIIGVNLLLNGTQELAPDIRAGS